MRTARRVFVLGAALAAVCVSLSPTTAGAFSGGGHRWAAEAAAQVYGAGLDPFLLYHPCLLPGETRYRLWLNTTVPNEPMVLDFQDICRDPRYGVPIMPELNLVEEWHNAWEDCIDTDCGDDYLDTFPLWKWLSEGAVEMDYIDGTFNTINHFWDADDGLHEFPNGTFDSDNAWEVAERMWVKAIDFWHEGNLGAAYTTLGYAMHLVQDMGQPAHPNEDMHQWGNHDSLEEWMTEEYCRAHFWASKDIEPHNGPTFPPPFLLWKGYFNYALPEVWPNDADIVVPAETIWEHGGEIAGDEYFTNPDLIAHYEMPQLFYIMYNMSQIGSFFASDGEDGNRDEGIGWLNDWYGFPQETDPWLYDADSDPPGYVSAQNSDGLSGGDDNDGCNCDFDGDLSKHIMPWGYGAAYNASKVVLELFRKTVDRVPPTSTCWIIIGDNPVSPDGWHNERATVFMSRHGVVDNANPGFRASGVWKLWGLVDGAWADQSDESGLSWTVNTEGEHLVQLMSTDFMGNVEQTDLTFKLDFTPPRIQVFGIKPAFDFCQEGNLTISWTANDLLSGVASNRAELDGEPVQNGQVFTGDMLGARPHSLLVSAQDQAGNQTAVEYPFETRCLGHCGDGTTDSGETCDDGNLIDGDGCDSNCTPTGCGNGTTTSGEECDGAAHCDPGCTCATGYRPDWTNPGFCVPTVCGNGFREGVETCDDGNSSDKDGCSSTCIVESGYTCSFYVAADYCTTTCGDGITAGTEACDDGNLVDGDGCDSNCTVTACGNGIVAGAEECEDGNDVDGDGCDSNCTVTACGNGIWTPDEGCDDGNLTDGDGCDSNCTMTRCGNGIVTGEELCDDGNLTSGDGCEWDCTPTVCGADPDNDTRWFATPFGGCGLTSAAVDCSGDVDFYSFTVPSAGSYTFATTPAGSASVGLYDSSGNSLDQGLTSVTRNLAANQQIFVRVMAATAASTFYYSLEITGCSAPPSPEYDYYVAATAKLAGAAGTNWVSDLAVLNPGSSTATITVALWLRDQANPDPQLQTGTLAAGELRKDLDVLSSLFGLDTGAASLHLHSDQPLVVGSRTYNDTGNGTYGQFIAGVADSELLQPSVTAYLGGLVENDDYRTNLGLLNPTADEIRVAVFFWSSDGTRIGDVTIFRVPAFGSIQSNRVLASVTSSQVADAWASINCSNGEFLAFASVVDNRTGDPVYRPAVGAPTEAVDVILSGAAKLSGAAGTNWVTDTAALNTRAADQTATVRLWLRDGDNSSPEESSLPIEGGQLIAARDVLYRLFGSTSDAGALQVVGGPGLLVGARTYNLVESGTYGQYIPAVDAGDAISGSAHGYLVMTAQSDDYRTNLGLVNIASQATDVEVRLWDADGNQVGATTTYSLEERGVIQVNRVVEEFTSQSLTAAYLELDIAPSTPDGQVHAYGSVVDQDTGDPIFERVSVVGSRAP